MSAWSELLHSRLNEAHRKRLHQRTSDEYIAHTITGFIQPDARGYSTEPGSDRQHDFGHVKKKNYPKLHGIIRAKGKRLEMRRRGEEAFYAQDDPDNEYDLLRDKSGSPIYMTKAQMKREKLPRYDTTIAVFDGNRPVALASNEWGVPGIWVDTEYQRLGIGLRLLKEFHKVKRFKKLGQATPAGRQMARAYHRSRVRDAMRAGRKVPDKVARDYYARTHRHKVWKKTIGSKAKIRHMKYTGFLPESTNVTGMRAITFWITPRGKVLKFSSQKNHVDTLFDMVRSERIRDPFLSHFIQDGPEVVAETALKEGYIRGYLGQWILNLEFGDKPTKQKVIDAAFDAFSALHVKPREVRNVVADWVPRGYKSYRATELFGGVGESREKLTTRKVARKAIMQKLAKQGIYVHRGGMRKKRRYVWKPHGRLMANAIMDLERAGRVVVDRRAMKPSKKRRNFELTLWVTPA
jgi:hypothetical protein